MLRNLRETITDKVRQEHRVLKERREGFVDNHEAVHAELERQLSSRNPRRAAARELTPINTGARGLEGHPESQDASQESDRSFDFSQTAFARVLGMLDSDPASLVGSQELTLGLAREGAMSPDRANRLSLSLDDSQEGQATTGGNILRQYDDEGQDNADDGNGHVD